MSNISSDGKTSGLYPATAAYHPGVILKQDIEDPYLNNLIVKVSLNLIVTASDHATVINGSGDNICFHAANWQSGRDQWAFQPINHIEEGFESSGTPIENLFQESSYSNSADAAENSPFLQYHLFFPESGNYDLWGYGYTSGTGIYWGFNEDLSHIRIIELGDGSSGFDRIPKWTKVGSVFVEQGGLNTFEVYLSDSSSVVILDQWLFTLNTELESQLHGDGLIEPMDLSEAPYMTAVRISDSNSNVTCWLSSVNIPASGKYNYLVQNNATPGVNFSTPMSIEFWQIGGSKDDFSAWSYTFPQSSVGNSHISTDYGQTYDLI